MPRSVRRVRLFTKKISVCLFFRVLCFTGEGWGRSQLFYRLQKNSYVLKLVNRVFYTLQKTHIFFAYTIYWKRKNSLAQQVCNYQESGKVNSSDGFESKLSKICLRKTLKGCLFVPRELFVYLLLKMKKGKEKPPRGSERIL